MSTALHTPLRAAGRLKDAQPEAAPVAPMPQHQVVVAEPVAVEVRTMPALNIATLPPPKAWVHRIVRGAPTASNPDGAMVEVISTPVIEVVS